MGISSFGISFYIILALSATTAGLGWLSLSLHDDKVVAEQALAQAINVNTEMQKSLNLKDLSCKIDDKSVVEVDQEKKEIQTKTDEVSAKIEKLRTPVAVKQEIIKNESLKETSVLPDDGLLSSNLKALLKQSFCSVEPEDAYCLESSSP